MPAPRSKKAPVMFNGDENDIAEFLEVYECCADDVQLPKKEWVKFIFWYIEQSQCLTFEAFNGYATEDWDVFRDVIKEAFGGTFQAKKCMHGTLDSFIQALATKPITMDTELCMYHHDFQGKAAYLVTVKSRTHSLYSLEHILYLSYQVFPHNEPSPFVIFELRFYITSAFVSTR